MTDSPSLQSLVAGEQQIAQAINAVGESIKGLSTIGAFVAAPAHSNSAGTASWLAYDGTYLYVCVANATWVRVAVSASW